MFISDNRVRLGSVAITCRYKSCYLTDTLIVWTEPDGVDYALSFQDPEGCAEVWQFIQEVQRHIISCESFLKVYSG